MKQLCAFLFACLLPGAAGAQDYDGRYHATLCDTGPLAEGGVELEGREIRFPESSCQMVDARRVQGLGNARVVDATCTGEGQDWEARYFIMNAADDSLVLVQNGGAVIYHYCGPLR